MQLIENLEWRYATKNFDPTKKVSEENLTSLKKAIQLSASSYGLQLYKVLIIEDKDLREKLKEASWGQSQVVDASHLLVFCSYSSVKEDHIDAYVKLKADTQGLNVEDLKGMGDFMKSKVCTLPVAAQAAWTAHQVYIALGTALAAAAELKIDSCPMEGFDPNAYNEILGLEEKGLNANALVAIGYRSTEDRAQHDSKVRKSPDDLFEVIG